MSDQQVPGFYAVGDEDTFLVSMDGEVFEVVRGGAAPGDGALWGHVPSSGVRRCATLCDCYAVFFSGSLVMRLTSLASTSFTVGTSKVM